MPSSSSSALLAPIAAVPPNSSSLFIIRCWSSSSLLVRFCFFIFWLLLLTIRCGEAQFLFQLDGPQPCPENAPIRLTALTRTVQYIYSPMDEHRNYPPDTDCQFLIEASDAMHRIHLTVLESELEEPLFTDCNDYVSVRDREGGGGDNEQQQTQSGAKEVARWCGQDFPAAVTSASDSLLVHFHSDSVIQKRGFNISFVQFALPGCPPGWTWDEPYAGQFCYKQFVLPHILTWLDAQKECNLERANLATFQSEAEYTFITKNMSELHSYPWIGYSDANVEGVFETVDKSAPIWPEKFPIKETIELKDCVYLDWNKRGHAVAYEIDDCRNRKPFLCKKRRDGTDAPVILPSGMIRRGLRDFSIDYTLLIGVIVLLLLALVIACLLYHKFKERNNRVVNVDLNQRLVQHQQHQQQAGGAGVAGSRSTMASASGAGSKSVSAQKAAAAAALAKEKARERAERREGKYAAEKGTKNAAGGGRTPPKPLQQQDSATSFPLQSFQTVFSRQAQMQMDRQMMMGQQHVGPSGRGGGEGESPSQSPRISLSPNQPELDEQGREKRRRDDEEEEDHGSGRRISGGGRGEDQAEEDEEEESRHNMGYEPDSEDEETGRRQQKKRRSSKEEEEEEGRRRKRREEDAAGRGRSGEEMGRGRREEEMAGRRRREEDAAGRGRREEDAGRRRSREEDQEGRYEEEEEGRRMKTEEQRGTEEFQQRVEVEYHHEEEHREEERQKEEHREEEHREEELKEELHEMERTSAPTEAISLDLIGQTAARMSAVAAGEHPVRPPIMELMRGDSSGQAEKPRREKREKEKEKLQEKAPEEQQPSPLPPHREGTLFSTGQQTVESAQSAGTTGGRMRTRRKSFDRPPPVGPLDNVSAISLDEFWQQQQQPQAQPQQTQPPQLPQLPQLPQQLPKQQK